jgi:non-heme chloroperoxidase
MSQKPEGFDSLKEVAEAIGRYQPHRKRPSTIDGLAKNVRLAADGKYRWHWDPLFRAGNFVVEQYQRRLETCALSLNLPTLLIRGALSDLLSDDGARAFLKLCRHSEYVNVADAAHMVAGDRNDIFGSAVIEFLSRVVPVSGARGR